MKILLVAEKEGTAIHRLCEYTKLANPFHDFKIVCVHPKRPSERQLIELEDAMIWCDVIDFRYWKTAELVKSLYDVKKPHLLTHYNPYDVDKNNWDSYKINIVVNSEQQRKIRAKSRLISLPVDVFYWDFTSNEQYQKNLDDPTIIMVVNRIEGKKGVLEVAEVAAELGLKMILVGSPSDPAYLEKVLERKNVTYYQAISNDELKALYKKSALHICNSIDNFESGTMPILEAMSSGIPVLTRKVGHVPDINDGTNMLVRSGAPDDLGDLEEAIKELLKDPEWLMRMRESAWNTVKNKNIQVYGMQYSKIYHEIFSEQPLVSVVIPTSERPIPLAKTLAHVIASNYPNLEIIVVDDGSESDEVGQVLFAIRNTGRHTVKYFKTTLYKSEDGDNPINAEFPNLSKIYGIARARNKGIIEAEGQWIMFLDDRLAIRPDTINQFVDRAKEGVWLWGVKDNFKKGFVENLSFIDRKSIVKIGMFNTSMEQYGGMTQDVRQRAELSGIKFELIEEAQANSLIKSSRRPHKKQDIAKSKIECYKLYGQR